MPEAARIEVTTVTTITRQLVDGESHTHWPPIGKIMLDGPGREKVTDYVSATAEDFLQAKGQLSENEASAKSRLDDDRRRDRNFYRIYTGLFTTGGGFFGGDFAVIGHGNFPTITAAALVGAGVGCHVVGIFSRRAQKAADDKNEIHQRFYSRQQKSLAEAALRHQVLHGTEPASDQLID